MTFFTKCALERFRLDESFEWPVIDLARTFSSGLRQCLLIGLVSRACARDAGLSAGAWPQEERGEIPFWSAFSGGRGARGCFL